MTRYFGGIEGGATNTVAVILDEAGAVVAREHGSGSNGWLLGVPKVADLLVALFHAAKASAGIPLDTPLAGMGLCMSGFLQERVQAELRAALVERDANLCAHYYVDNDSPGSVYTAAGPAGGLVIICGTGTMAQLIDPHGAAYNCGGWGHMFGDEASAYDIAASAIRGIFHATDGYAPDPAVPVPDARRALEAMFTYFKVDNRDGMLDVFYKSFDKAFVAGFTRHLAKLADDGDAFSRALFTHAGRKLGSMARTLAPRLLPAFPSSPRDVVGLGIVCVGSVWRSWPLLRDGFIETATAPFAPAGPAYTYAAAEAAACAAAGPDAAPGRITSFRLLRLTESSAVGAAWRGARDVGADLPIDFSKTAEVLFEWRSQAEE